MNEAFEEAKARHLRGIIKAIFRDLAEYDFTAGWQAALAHLREPQTAETCQAVPPHPRMYLIADIDHEVHEFKGATCLVCEAVKQARDDERKATIAESKSPIPSWATGVILARVQAGGEGSGTPLAGGGKEMSTPSEILGGTCQKERARLAVLLADTALERNHLKEQRDLAQAKCAEMNHILNNALSQYHSLHENLRIQREGGPGRLVGECQDYLCVLLKGGIEGRSGQVLLGGEMSHTRTDLKWWDSKRGVMHSARGDRIVENDSGTFLVWTDCLIDVPANAAKIRDNQPDCALEITCLDCLALRPKEGK